MQDVTIPALGMAMTEAVLTRWYKEPGEAVAAGEVIAEIETDKSAVDLESPADGVLGPHLVGEGAEVPVGAAVTRVLDHATPAAARYLSSPMLSSPMPRRCLRRPRRPRRLPRPRPAVPRPRPPHRCRHPQPHHQPAGTPRRTRTGSCRGGPTVRAPHKLSPRKRMQARLTAEAAAREAGGPPSADSPGPAPDQVVPVRDAAPPAAGGLTGRRAAVAQAVAESWRTIPHFSVQREIDASDADASLAAMRAQAPEATYTDLLLRAFALAVNSVGQHGSDLGLAVATPDGVMMPIVAGVPDLDVPGLVAARKAATKRGRAGRLAASDLAGPAVAAISNLGARGVDSFTGIVPTGRLPAADHRPDRGQAGRVRRAPGGPGHHDRNTQRGPPLPGRRQGGGCPRRV